MLHLGVTQEWVDKGELPRERKKKSEKTKALCCVGKGHTWRSRSPMAGELDCFSAHIRLREPDMSEDKADGVEAGGRKGRGSDDESSGAQLPKSKASVRKEVDSEEHHSAIEAYLPIVKEGCRCKVTDSRAMGLATPWYAEGRVKVCREMVGTQSPWARLKAHWKLARTESPWARLKARWKLVRTESPIVRLKARSKLLRTESPWARLKARWKLVGTESPLARLKAR
ncbi:hypothetical protein BHM03_00005850 [Ensete ventricosum]|nr:hypothetical protein BHM03_00005850 [Ensete ventricosum]